MNETGKNHLVFKLKPIKVLEGVPTSVQNQRARRARHTATKRSKTRGSPKTRRQRRDVTVRMPERKVETLVVIDRKMMEYHKSKEMLQPYVLTIMNIVSTSSKNNGNICMYMYDTMLQLFVCVLVYDLPTVDIFVWLEGCRMR